MEVGFFMPIIGGLRILIVPLRVTIVGNPTPTPQPPRSLLKGGGRAFQKFSHLGEGVSNNGGGIRQGGITLKWDSSIAFTECGVNK